MAEPRLFTVEEANKLLPEVRRVLAHLRAARAKIDQLEKDKAIEELSWLQPDGSVSSQAQEALARMDKEQKAQASAFEMGFKEMHRLGAQLKDLDDGLVDFFAGHGDQLVCLCWKEGEDKIRFWHDMESGFAGRRPVEELE